MSNRTVNECRGILVDSETGNSDFPTGYYHNENYVFTICVPNSPQITLVFSDFHTEECCDSLEIFDGPDVNSPRIGTYKGFNSPGTVVSSGSCITIRFRSDANVTAEGWLASWTVVPPIPIVPTILPIANVPCESTSVTVTFDQPILCSQLTAANFAATGPAGGAITSVTPLNCTNGFATSAVLNYASPLNESGSYNLDFSFTYIDICGDAFKFQITASFNIIDCPLEVDLVGNINLCTGTCNTLSANVRGGNPATYQYLWTPGGATTPSISVCPTVATQYRVTVTDGASQPAFDTLTVNVLSLPNAGNDTAMCRFGTPVILSGTPTGGNWNGPGITNGNTGAFNPANAGGGIHNIRYFGPNGCPDTVQITVHNVSAGARQSACVNTPSFNLIGTPAGGTWTGTNTSPTGNFNPIQTGTFTVSYTEPVNGCIATQTVKVIDSIDLSPIDSIVVCINQPAFNLRATPGNGRWTGNGVNQNGNFNPANAGNGVHVLYYTINGCSDSTNVAVNTIAAGPDQLVCPLDTGFALNTGTPVRGIWTGNGVVDNGDTTYTFRPALATINSNIILTYTFGACSASKTIFLYNTTVSNDTLSFCPTDGNTILRQSFYQANIPGGTWSGASIVSDSTLNPQLLAPGINYVYYEFNNNGCVDSLAVLLKEKPIAQADVNVCALENDFDLNALPLGGTWSGFGIIDSLAGTFSPNLTTNGNFQVIYNLSGCTDTVSVIVKPNTTDISPFKPYYCLKNELINLSANPMGGVWSGTGVSPTGQFNPKTAGSGSHLLYYTFGNGACAVKDSAIIKVIGQIKINLVYDTKKLCFGDSILVRVVPTGGDSLRPYRYTWDHFTGDTARLFFKPTTLTNYSVVVNDGCSDSARKDFFIDVFPEIRYNILKGPFVCYGLNNWAKVDVLNTPRDNFEVTWNTTPPTVADSLNTITGNYRAVLKDKLSNCRLVLPVNFNYHPYLEAGFVKQPEENCQSILTPDFYFLNQSSGVDSGYWSMGDGKIFNYDPNFNPAHSYEDTGSYQVKLFVKNNAGCTDSVVVDLCITPIKRAFIPTGFSPNGDGDNDLFPHLEFVNGKYLPKGFGLVDYEMQIWDRWGELVYDNKKTGLPWNGKLNNTGKLLKPDVYVYIMQLTYENQEPEQIEGRITLVR